MTVQGYKMDHWGRNREVVSLEDYVLVRPIAKAIDWPIAEAIGFEGVDRRFLTHEMPNGRAQFTIAKGRESAFRSAGTQRARDRAALHEKRLREDAAYQNRVQREGKEREIYAEHRRETAAALTDYQTETSMADADYGEARIKAGEIAGARKSAATAAYNAAVTEADEDRDEALAALNT